MPRKNFKIENSLYPKKYVLSTIKDFADFSIRFEDGMLTINADSPGEIKEIFNEFMNFILTKINENS